MNAGSKGFGLYCAFENGALHTCEKVYLGNPKKAAVSVKSTVYEKNQDRIAVLV